MQKRKITRKRQGVVIVVSAPSGCGKTTIVNALLKTMPQLRRSISATTRMKRTEEREGRDYYFLTKKDFIAKTKRGFFLEWARVFDNLYGTPLHAVETVCARGYDVILTIDVQGARQLRKKIAQGVFVFIVPPTMKALKERLSKRGTDSSQEIAKRLKEARRELAEIVHYDYVVVNDRVSKAVQAIQQIIESEHYKVTRNKEVVNGICST